MAERELDELDLLVERVVDADGEWCQRDEAPAAGLLAGSAAGGDQEREAGGARLPDLLGEPGDLEDERVGDVVRIDLGIEDQVGRVADAVGEALDAADEDLVRLEDLLGFHGARAGERGAAHQLPLLPDCLHALGDLEVGAVLRVDGVDRLEVGLDVGLLLVERVLVRRVTGGERGGEIAVPRDVR